jgi:hypothetical protein
MNDGSFERVTDSDAILYGPRKILFCGFPAPTHDALGALLKMVGISDAGAIWVSAEQAAETMAALFEKPDGFGKGEESSLPRAIIVGGIPEKALHALMAGARASGMKPPLWAVLTPASESWPLERLLQELAAEREALG